MKTESEMAVLFYNTGPSSNQDFVALELWKGRPRLLVDQVYKMALRYFIIEYFDIDNN